MIICELWNWIVLNFFQASLRNCKNCNHNCEDHSSFDFISAVHIWFISYASFTYISFTGTYEPKLTCSQRQWLHSSVGRASHRYREVTGSSPLEVLNFFSGFFNYAIVKIAIITARIILHLISYPQFTYDLFHMHHSLTYLSREHMNPNWPAPNVSGFIAQLVERRTGIARSRVQAPLKSWIFFRLLYAIVKIAIITARIILHLIPYPQFTYDLFHMHHSLR